jgi:surface antigen
VFANKPNSGVKDMATTKTTFETIPVGTDVTWHYRSAIGHGTVIGVHKIGTTADNTMYSVRQHDHHPGEPDILHHSGKALSTVDS